MDNREPRDLSRLASAMYGGLVHSWICEQPTFSPEEFEVIVRYAYSRIRWQRSEHTAMCLRLNSVLEGLKLYLPVDGVERFRLGTDGVMQPKENSVTVLPAFKAGEQVWIDDEPQFTEAELEGPH
jgi:hypothetical protein